MRKITKNLSTVTKVLMITLLMAGVSVSTYAQKDKKAKKEKVIKRPALAGHAATDKFVDSSFDVYERNQKLSKKLSDAKGNAADAGKIKKDLESQVEEIKGLLGQSGDVLKGAKSITPKTNSMKAVKAINAATKALNATQKAIPAQIEAVKKQGTK
ncbi:MAG: hypothetical protein JKY30_13710 [Flavobacteriales bacterium]|nr:hypothetical protein [Flavobacteriales bacterium]